ncbi:hypothetical protein UNPF46_04630 [Bradyrhizobium sp. UNPF46]|nr:hypothetical protein UNPF46_04630 [Bradyrhizobium sp. UNPF46]
MATSGAYGGDGTQYRTEIESFSKIISHGSAGSGPAWFEVRTKSGQTMEFGNTADSRLLAEGQASARVWGVNKVSDSKSNFYAVTYTSDLTNGQFYPSRIDYTGNTATEVSASNSVQFVYATRPDTLPQYQAGSRITTAFRLTNVQARAGSTFVSDYRLAYEQSGPANRSRVTEISVCGASGSCLPSTSLNWTNATAGFGGRQAWTSDRWGVSSGWTDNNQYPRRVTDLNGDGLPDIVGFAASGVYVALNTGTGFGGRQLWTSDPWGVSSGWTDNNQYPRMIVDVNGDGLPDIVGFAASGVYVATNISSGPAPDVTTNIANGIGSSTMLTYQPSTNTSVVTKGTGTVFPLLDLVSPAHVVSQVDRSNGVGGTVSASYTYSGGRIDIRRRGFLGFAQTNVKDLQTGIVSTTTYRKDFPYIGSVASMVKSLTPATPPGGAAAQAMTLSQSSNTYQFSNASGAASVSTPSINSAPYKVSLSQSVSSGSDLDGTALPSVTTTNQYDAYLNPTQVVTSTSDGFSKTTVSTYSNDTSAWYLGRLTRSSVTGVAP